MVIVIFSSSLLIQDSNECKQCKQLAEENRALLKVFEAHGDQILILPERISKHQHQFLGTFQETRKFSGNYGGGI